MTERNPKLLKSDQAVTEPHSDIDEHSLEPAKLTQEEAAVMAAYLILSNDPEGYKRAVERWGRAVGQWAFHILQDSAFTPQAKAALVQPFTVAVISGFLMGLEVAKGDR